MEKLRTLEGIFRRVWFELHEGSFPLRTRADLAYFRVAERVALPERFPLHFAGGILYLGRQTVSVDYAVLDYVFRRQMYRTGYEGATVIDVGAHKGYFGAYALSRGADVVVSFEPELQNYDALERTAETFRRHGKKWHTHRAAVAATSGEGVLNVSEESWAHSLVSGVAAGTQTERVSLLPFSGVLGEVNGAKRTIVKLNAEGAECDIVMKTGSDIWARVDELFIEIHGFAPCAPGTVLQHLRSAGLIPYKQTEEGPHVLFALKSGKE